MKLRGGMYSHSLKSTLSANFRGSSSYAINVSPSMLFVYLTHRRFPRTSSAAFLGRAVCVAVGSTSKQAPQYTMPAQWPAELYDCAASKVVHNDILELELQEGKRFKCKFCKNTKTKDRARYFQGKSPKNNTCIDLLMLELSPSFPFVVQMRKRCST